MRRTWQPKKLKRVKKFGFMSRNSTPGGRRVLKRRITKGRYVLSVSDEFRIADKKRFIRK